MGVSIKATKGHNMSKVTDKQMDEIVRGYIVAGLWTTTDDETLGGEHLDSEYDASDVNQTSMQTIRELCKRFIDANEDDVVAYLAEQDHVRHQGQGTASDYFGHDLWLSSNGHGAGFFDRDLGELGDRLQKAAQDFDTVGLFIDPETDQIFAE